MLPDIPTTKEEIAKALQLRIRNFVESKVTLVNLTRSRSIAQHEGIVHSHQQEDGNVVSEGFEMISAPVEVKAVEVPLLIGDQLLKKIDEVADQMARSMSQMTFRKLNEVLSQGDGEVGAGGREFSKEFFLEAMAKLEMDFDEQGRPTTVIIAHPDMAEVMLKQSEEWERDSAFQKRLKAMYERKRESWRDRESNRKLVD